MLTVNNKLTNILDCFLSIAVQRMKSDNIVILAYEMMVRFDKLQ